MEKRYVLDTSVWINLLATEFADRILALLSVGLLVPPQILKEVVRDPVTDLRYTTENHPFSTNISISNISLTDREIDIFIELVSGRSIAKLGDGEAASIAVASERGAVLAVDETKARRVVRELFPHITLTSSAELLTRKEVIEGLGAEAAEACYQKALSIGGMHPVTK